MNLDEFFVGRDESRRIFDRLQAVVEQVCQSEGGTGPLLRVSRSQVAFRRRKAFAWAWVPGFYLRGRTAPLVLTLSLPQRDGSPRWKEVVEPRPGRFTHHLELWEPGEVDGEVRSWLRQAWECAG